MLAACSMISENTTQTASSQFNLVLRERGSHTIPHLAFDANLLPELTTQTKASL